LASVASFGLIASRSTPERSLTWEQPAQGQNLTALVASARAKAQAEDKPLFLDFTADWCTACKEIENKTFPDMRVQAEAGRFIAVKMDMTDASDPAVEKAFEEFTVRGLPTLILFDSNGRESARFNGEFVPAERLVEAMANVD
jgi:thiol:disulfide interchange protein DsbD